MIITKQSVTMLKLDENSGKVLLKACEYAGRNCYASQSRITEDSCFTFINNLIQKGHETPLEFADITFDITTSRAVLAELTRHRLASFCVESQRYIQEAKSGDITFIVPEWFESTKKEAQLNFETYSEVLLGKNKEFVVSNSPSMGWLTQMYYAEEEYKKLISEDCKPEEAREVLPNSTACRIIMKANLREWRHIFELRCSKAAYPQMRSLAKQMLQLAHERIPVVFDDLYTKYIENKGD